MTKLVLWMDSSQTFPVHQSEPFSIFLFSHDGALNCGQKFPSTLPVHGCQGHLGLLKNHFFEIFFRGETIVQHSSLMTLKNKFELMLKFLWSTQFKSIHRVTRWSQVCAKKTKKNYEELCKMLVSKWHLPDTTGGLCMCKCVCKLLILRG